MEKDILGNLFDDKILSILRLFYSDGSQKFYMREISKKAGVPVASTFRIITKLVNLHLLDEFRIKKFKLYRLGDNENTRFLGQLIKKEKQALQVFITKAKLMKGLNRILLQGEEEKDKANVILIGDNLDQAEVKRICGFIRQNYNFTVLALVLADEQFKQMDAMGLYPGKKKTIFKATEMKDA